MGNDATRRFGEGRFAATRLAALLVLVACALVAAGCARQPDDATIATALQAELDAALGGRVLQVESLRRAGSASAESATAGDIARLVYFNARLRLARDYDFSRWESHSVGTLGNLLGAGPKGIEGVKPDGNRAGDELTVYGTLGFERRGNDWVVIATSREPGRSAEDLTRGLGPIPGAPRGRGREDATPPSPAEVALERMRALAATQPTAAVSATQRDRIVAEELERAYVAAHQRLERAQRETTLAGGPAGGAYAVVTLALAERARAAGQALAVSTSEGSVGNIRELATGQAQFALVQNDTAVAAYLGRGRFSGSPQSALRAVASLFPEPVHLVAAARSGIRSVEDLRGKRVAIGPEDSGTRPNALAILASAGVAVESLSVASPLPVADAAAALAAGELDALFATAHAPAATITQLATRTRLAWIPIPASATPREVGLIPFVLPPRTYPGQTEAVPTVAATALLITNADVPQAAVEEMLRLLFDAPDPRRAQSAPLAQINRRSAREGVTIPWSPAAEAFLAGPPAATAPAAAATAKR